MRRLSAALSAVKRSPRISISPAVGSSRPVRQPMVVLLPEPFGPRKPNIEPFGTASERFSTATTVPYFFTRLEMRMASMGQALPSTMAINCSRLPRSRPEVGAQRDGIKRHSGDAAARSTSTSSPDRTIRGRCLVEDLRAEKAEHHAADDDDVADQREVVAEALVVIAAARAVERGPEAEAVKHEQARGGARQQHEKLPRVEWDRREHGPREQRRAE